MSDPKCSRWVVGALAAAALALVVVVSSTVPTEVSPVFTEDVLSLGAIVVVADSTGKDWADGTVLLDGTEATQTLKKGMPDGDYQVRWRVVSVDGHPVSWSLTFAVGTRASAAYARPTSTAAPTPTSVADAAVAGHGVMSTLVLVVDEKVVVSGRAPILAELRTLLSAAASLALRPPTPERSRRRNPAASGRSTFPGRGDASSG
ncbi:copper resistance protein CopC [Cryobacterium algoritolerans]|uniref:Copper resistance protein CopC n=1 Tax=Cryobacterium algoritolerans TaxID=1259184 RepID=A0A4R8WIW7_9MICO|nr:copper resistance protein CopC [Cryobacterium algoritolerans]TFC10375.1 copper resistance protein CopC [Cryobacterium algoritolerans]